MIDRTMFPIRRRKHARPHELLVAAMALFVEKGFAAARPEEIAERAGVSKGTLYLYFDGKEHLFTDLIAERFFCPFRHDRVVRGLRCPAKRIPAEHRGRPRRRAGQRRLESSVGATNVFAVS